MLLTLVFLLVLVLVLILEKRKPWRSCTKQFENEHDDEDERLNHDEDDKMKIAF